MFREMRRSRQSLSASCCAEILRRHTVGVLSVLGDGGYPYGVPVNYCYAEGKLYFHCARSGHKTDAIAREDKVSFCVIDRDDIVQEELTAYYRSVIVFGRARIVTEEAEKHSAAMQLAAACCPDISVQRCEQEIAQHQNALTIVRIDIEHMSGKEAIELTKKQP